MEALRLTREEIVEWLEGTGWWVATWDDEGALVGHYDALLILAHDSEIRAVDPTFELYDGKRGLSYWVRVIPTPRTAARLLEQHGQPLAKERERP